MTDKALKRLSRAELLEMLLAQVEENEQLKKRLAQLQAQLENRQILIQDAGSIAEAAMQLNNVFQAADAAASQYLENVQRLSGEGESIRLRLEAEAKKDAEAIRAAADAYSRLIRSRADQYQQQIVEKIQAMLHEQGGVELLLRSCGEEKEHEKEKESN